MLTKNQIDTIVNDLKYKPFTVLDDGHVMLVDVMGGDFAICEAARVSYGAGIKKRSNDTTLIRYLMRHGHTTPFEMVEFKFRVRVPMDTWRQWIRHRTACLAGDVVVSFDQSNDMGHYTITVAEIYEQFNATNNRLYDMPIRSYNEHTHEVYHTRINNVWKSGVKKIMRVEFDGDKILRASEDHLCLTNYGWFKLKDAINMNAMFLSSNLYSSKIGAPQEQYASDVISHSRHHDYDTQYDSYDDEQASIPIFTKPIRWNWDGEEMTYDISVDGPYHNFFAGGVVVHNSVNEYSTRYSEAITHKQKTPFDQWRHQSESNKQGSDGSIDSDNLSNFGQMWLKAEDSGAKADGVEPRTPGQYLSDQEENLHTHATQVYNERLRFGIAREQARKDLPLSTYTDAYWKINLHNLLHFLDLRMNCHAQQEIREYALIIGEQIVSKIVPVTWQAFRDYRFDAICLTKLECDVISRIYTELSSGNMSSITESEFMELQHDTWSGLKQCRERDECLEKFKQLGIVV